MVDILPNKTTGIDFSFMLSLQCNIKCPFCMYDAGPDKKDIADMNMVKKFCDTIDWNSIRSIGFYGGEPSINLDLYREMIRYLPVEIPKWIITNGTWSRDAESCRNFVNFIVNHGLYTIVSGTPYHQQFQNRDKLEWYNKSYNFIKLKGDDGIIPMGRAAKENWLCTQKCKTSKKATRLALKPNGDIIYQNCDGVYPVVGHYGMDYCDVVNNINNSLKLCQNK